MTDQKRRRMPRPAFTLVELLVVLAIIGVLLALTASAVQRVRSTAARILCADRLRQLGLALHAYHGTHSVFPPGTTRDLEGGEHRNMSWHTRILPYLEQDTLWKRSLDAYAIEPRFSYPPHPFAVALSVFECPTDPRAGAPARFGKGQRGLTSFLGVEGTDYTRQDGVLFVDSRTRLTDITDGTSNTLLVGERPPSPDNAFGWWYAGLGQLDGNGSADMVLGALEYCAGFFAPDCAGGPYQYGPGELSTTCDMFHFWSLHPGGAHFVMADASVQFLSYSAKDILPALATRAGGEVASLP
jgi:prepilin-type N-terminal cleavage/methylation domain-containing protein